MKSRIQLNPLVGLAGITVLAAAVLAATHAPHAGAERSVTPDLSKTLVTTPVPMGDGEIHAWVRLDPAGAPAALGGTFP